MNDARILKRLEKESGHLDEPCAKLAISLARSDQRRLDYPEFMRGENGKRLFLASYLIVNAGKEYETQYTIRAQSSEEAVKIAKFFAKDFWMEAETAEPVEGRGNAWYSPDGAEFIQWQGIAEMTPKQVAYALLIDVDARRMKELMR
jgi:hypothetical protein